MLNFISAIENEVYRAELEYYFPRLLLLQTGPVAILHNGTAVFSKLSVMDLTQAWAVSFVATLQHIASDRLNVADCSELSWLCLMLTPPQLIGLTSLL